MRSRVPTMSQCGHFCDRFPFVCCLCAKTQDYVFVQYVYKDGKGGWYVGEDCPVCTARDKIT